MHIFTDVSIRVKEFFEPIVLRKKADGFLLFSRLRSLSLRLIGSAMFGANFNLVTLVGLP